MWAEWQVRTLKPQFESVKTTAQTSFKELPSAQQVEMWVLD